MDDSPPPPRYTINSALNQSSSRTSTLTFDDIASDIGPGPHHAHNRASETRKSARYSQFNYSEFAATPKAKYDQTFRTDRRKIVNMNTETVPKPLQTAKTSQVSRTVKIPTIFQNLTPSSSPKSKPQRTPESTKRLSIPNIFKDAKSSTPPPSPSASFKRRNLP